MVREGAEAWHEDEEEDGNASATAAGSGDPVPLAPPAPPPDRVARSRSPPVRSRSPRRGDGHLALRSRSPPPVRSRSPCSWSPPRDVGVNNVQLISAVQSQVEGTMMTFAQLLYLLHLIQRAMETRKYREPDA